MNMNAAGSLTLAIVVFATLLASAHAADAPAEVRSAVDRAVHPLLAEHGAPGVAVAVTVAGQQYFFSYGFAANDTKTAVTEDTLFEIGSVSKTVTATLAAYAQALGKLSLDDHPGKYMPALRDSALDQASLLHLGTYTAGGLPLQLPDGVSNDAAMATYFEQWQPAAQPGTQRRYSNPSIGLLGHITALAMSGDFAELVETELFSRLGLDRSYIRVPKTEMARYAWGHNKAGKAVRVTPAVLDAEAYGVKASAADLIRFVECNLRPEILEPPLRQAVEGTHIGYFKVGEMVQGLGWEQYPWPVTLEQLLAGNSTQISMKPNPTTPLTPPRVPAEPTLFNKTGSTGGFGAYVAFMPAEQIGIVILANKAVPIPARITAAHALLEQLASAEP